ncbi:MAG TPA: DUF1259 domain-containing protein, partial [Nitrospira sp.]|nr:DUF1259 domain-containing protein [Nitrospira sp.]
LLLVFFPGHSQSEEPPKASKTLRDNAAIEREIGQAGERKGDVYKISFPRTDLNVTVDGVTVKPGLALGSWMAFRPTGKTTIVDGDLVLTEDEVYPVLRELQQHGLTVTALHNHLLQESPKIMYLHFWGEGDAAKLSSGLKQALSRTKTPVPPPQEENTKTEDGFDAEQVQQILGQKGALKRGVLHVSVPRPEKITVHGVELPPSMGMATVMNFQAAGDGKVAATGDFVMIDEDVNSVAQALTEQGIRITALHNHLLHDSPDLFFMHFWAHDFSEKVAQGLRAWLDAMNKK